jgi:hypothetical protein
MLAQSLVSCARLIPAQKPAYLFTGLATHEHELQARVDRLLLGSHPGRTSATGVLALMLSVGVALTGLAFLLALGPWLSAGAEAVLHLG